MRYLAKDLQPGVTYAIQIRSVSGDDVSPWSPIFIIETASDSTLPANVASVTGLVQGSSFALSWPAVTTNSNATPIRDLKDYEITITSGSNSVVRYSTTTKFLYTYDMNVEDFTTPDPSLDFAVKARDVTGNTSATPATVSLVNGVPANVATVTVTAHGESLHVEWSAVADTDLAGYIVYADTTSGFTPGPTNIVYNSGPHTLSFNYPAPSGTTIYFKVQAEDVFGQLSASAGAGSSAATPVAASDSVAFPFNASGNLTVSTGTSRLPIDKNSTIVSVIAMVGTAPTGANVIIDVNKNGTTIFTNQAHRPTISASTNSSGTVTNMDVTSLSAGDYITIDIDQIGSTVAGADLTVVVRIT